MKQLVLVLALLGAAIAGRLEHLESQYLPPTGQSRIPSTSGSQYTATPSTQFAGLNRYPGSTATQYSQSQQPIAFGTASVQYPHQQGQYSPRTQDGQYYQENYGGAKGQYATQYSGAATVRAENQPNGGDGTYSYSFETSNGISAQESGTGSVGAQGGYSYTSPEGEVISVRYTADADGFHPEGSHIAGSEAIRKSIEINKAEAASGRYQEGQYQEQGYDGSARQYSATGFQGTRGQFNQQYATPGQQYNSHNQQYSASVAKGQFGVGSQQQYGVPSQRQQFGTAQKQQYNTPNEQYGAPGARNQFGVGSQQQYGVPSQQQQFGIAQKQYIAPGQQYSAPNQQYGAPGAGNQFGVGSQQQYGVPAQQYRASSQHSTPSQQYDTSRQNQFDLGQQYGTSSSRSTVGARQNFGVPAPQYGTPTGPLRAEDSNQGYRY